MNRAQLHALLRRARELSGHREFIIVGSLAILGAVADPPDGMAFFVDPNDVAVSKYVRGEERDMRWLREGLKSGLLNIDTIARRIGSAPMLDGELPAARKRISGHKKRLKL